MISISATTDRERAVWRILLDLAEWQRHWTLIGARMVELHAAERGESMRRLTIDADALADARERPSAVGQLAQILVDDGFELSEPTQFGEAHTFRKGRY
jgi:hypothetical protein